MLPSLQDLGIRAATHRKFSCFQSSLRVSLEHYQNIRKHIKINGSKIFIKVPSPKCIKWLSNLPGVDFSVVWITLFITSSKGRVTYNSLANGLEKGRAWMKALATAELAKTQGEPWKPGESDLGFLEMLLLVRFYEIHA